MKSPISPDIVNQLPGVGSPAISPDGTAVAYVRGQVEDGKRVSWIECAPFAGGESRRLTSGDSDSGPVWSPDGSVLAFLRPGSSEASAPRQIWLLPSDGGEARKLTDLPHSVAGFDWLPDGSGMIATVDIDPHRGQRDGSTTTVVRETYYRGDALGYREDAWHQLFRIDASSGEALQLTTGTYNHAHPVISPDGRWVAFTADRNVDREMRRPFGSELCVMSIQGVTGGSHIERLTPGVMSAGKPCWSPDGSALAVSVTDMSQRHQAYLERVERYSGKRTRLTDDRVNPQSGFFPIAGPPTMAWTDDGITFAADIRGRSAICRASPDGTSEPEMLRTEAELINGFDVSADGRAVAIVSTTPDAPGEIVTIGDGTQAVLTSASEDFVESHEIGDVEFFTVERDGWEIPCGLMYPPGFDPEKSYPLVMEIHGGPNGFFGEGIQRPAPGDRRCGLPGLVRQPARLVDIWCQIHRCSHRRLGRGRLARPAARPRCRLRASVRRRQPAGRARLFVRWIHDHLVDRTRQSIQGGHCWRSGCQPLVDVGRLGHWTVLGLIPVGRCAGRQLRLVPASAHPITYVQNVKCPVLILHGEHDWRVPISQGEEYFAGLRYRGKTAEMVRFPGCFTPNDEGRRPSPGQGVLREDGGLVQALCLVTSEAA